MGIRVEYTVEKLSPSYVTKETIFSYVPSEDDPKVKVRKEEVVEHRGGYLVKFMRGHSIRLFDDAHLAAFNNAMRGSKDRDSVIQIGKTARLVDEVSGMECNAQGIPLDIQHLVAPNHDGSNEELPSMGIEANDDPIGKAIEDTA